MSGTTQVTLGSLSADTTIPSGAGVLLRQPSVADPTKLVFGTVQLGTLPTWTTSTRPTLTVGQAVVGYNTTIPQFEYGIGSSSGTIWIASLGAGSGTGGSTTSDDTWFLFG